LKEIDKWEDIKNDFPYLDILYLDHPTSKKHPRQPMASRAGQFSPFAALTGYEDAVKETARYTDHKLELEEEAKQKLDETIHLLQTNQFQEEVKITHFQKDKRKQGGKYLESFGKIKKIDVLKGFIELYNKEKILIQDIVKIEIIDTQE